MKVLFSERIKELREAKEMTPSQFACLFDKSESAVRAWEADRTKPNADDLLNIADYFGISTDYLLGHEPPDSKESFLNMTVKQQETEIENLRKKLSEIKSLCN